jgi:hypothetical protein
MQFRRNWLMALVPVLALGACTTLSEQDRALLSAANQNAEQAKTMAQQALDASRAAQASANSAAQAADAAASNAQAASEKSDRMFQPSLRKTGSSQ